MARIEVLLTEERILDGFISNLKAGRIPEQYFYWSPQSASAWLALCRSSSYLNYRRSLGLLVARGAELFGPSGSLPAEIVSLGAGDGSKEIPILDALSARGVAAGFVAVDVSQWLLESAIARVEASGHRARGIKADLADPSHLAAIASDSPAGHRLYTLLGNTVGALDHATFLPALAAVLRPGDRLAVDAEIYQPAATLPGYLNADNRRFATGPLRTIGIGDADGEVVFELVEESDPPGLRRLRKHFIAARAFEMRIGDEKIPVKPGGRLEMGFSCKYTRESLLEILRRHGGFTIEKDFLSEDGGFLLAVARVRGS